MYTWYSDPSSFYDAPDIPFVPSQSWSPYPACDSKPLPPAWGYLPPPLPTQSSLWPPIDINPILRERKLHVDFSSSAVTPSYKSAYGGYTPLTTGHLAAQANNPPFSRIRIVHKSLSGSLDVCNSAYAPCVTVGDVLSKLHAALYTRLCLDVLHPNVCFGRLSWNGWTEDGIPVFVLETKRYGKF